MRACGSLSRGGCADQQSSPITGSRASCTFRVTPPPPHREGHTPGDSLCPVQEPTGSALPGWRTRTSALSLPWEQLPERWRMLPR